MSDAPNSLGNRVFWSQVVALTAANLRARYRKTWAGFVWVVLHPLILYGVQSQVFSRFLKIDVSNYALFLASGLLPWIFLTQSLQMTTPLFTSQGRLLKSYSIDPRVYLFAQLADNLVNFAGAFLLVLIPVVLWQDVSLLRLASLPLCLIPLIIGTTGLSWLLASLQVFYADVRFLVQFGISVLFFLTPVFYPAEFVPPDWRWALHLNPLRHWIAPFQAALYHGNWATFATAWAVGLAFAAAMIGFAAGFWRRYRDAIYHRL